MIQDRIGWIILAGFVAFGIFMGNAERNMILQVLKPPTQPVAPLSDCLIIRLEPDGTGVCEAIRHIDWRPSRAFGQNHE